MRRLVWHLLLCACAAGGASCSGKPDLKGQWSGTVTDDASSKPLLVQWQLEHNGSAVTGVATVTAAGTTVTGTLNGTLDASTLSFTMTLPDDRCPSTTTGSAAVTGSSISGAVTATNPCINGRIQRAKIALTRGGDASTNRRGGLGGLLAGWLSRDLTREQAGKLLTAELSRLAMPVGDLVHDETADSCNQVLAAGVFEQLWESPPQPTQFRDRHTLTLTTQGRQFFTRIDVGMALLVGCSGGVVTPVKPIPGGQLIQVTGIRPDGEDKRVTEFQWRFDAPAVVLRYVGLAVGPVTSEATFQRYDDGWRIRTTDALQKARRRFVRDPQAEAKGRALAEAQRQQAMAAQRDREERWRLARTATTSIGTYRFERFTRQRGFGTMAGTDAYEVQLSDAGFVIKHVERTRSGSTTRTSQYWWWQVIAIGATGTSITFTLRTPQSYPLMLEKFNVEIADDGKGDVPIAEAGREMQAALASWRERFPEFANMAEFVRGE